MEYLLLLYVHDFQSKSMYMNNYETLKLHLSKTVSPIHQMHDIQIAIV
jgi:hypothetical protein